MNKDKKKVKVLSQTQVDKFKMSNPNWKQMGAGEIGQKLNADYVLEIWLDKMRLYQPRSDNSIYEGRAEAFVSIYEIKADGGELKDKYPLSFSYRRPPGRSRRTRPRARSRRCSSRTWRRKSPRCMSITRRATVSPTGTDTEYGSFVTLPPGAARDRQGRQHRHTPMWRPRQVIWRGRQLSVARSPSETFHLATLVIS